ncbi:MAG TPA: tetratricopeptide repeat protein [Gemmatimonadales bacterium]|nr:tetratricopeptide repeat protein [Gemmatimonadales bacterium]
MGTSAQPGIAPAHQDALERLIAWVKANPRKAVWPLVILVVGGGLVAWNVVTSRSSEQAASRALGAARIAFENDNYSMAASELSQITANYSGTHAAQEATLLLANSRILQGQPQQAVDLLTKFSEGAGAPYRAQAYGLLGNALENMVRPGDAAVAYQHASEHATLPFLQAQYLLDAGRAYAAAGDTTKAVASLSKIVIGMDSTGYITEAKVRLGELTRGGWKDPKLK